MYQGYIFYLLYHQVSFEKKNHHYVLKLLLYDDLIQIP